MGRKLFIVVNIVFFMLVGMILYQAFKIYLMKESINTEIMMLEEKVNEYTEKNKNLQSKIDNIKHKKHFQRGKRKIYKVKLIISVRKKKLKD